MKIKEKFQYHVFCDFDNARMRAIRNTTTLITSIYIDDDNVRRAADLKMHTIHKQY